MKNLLYMEWQKLCCTRFVMAVYIPLILLCALTTQSAVFIFVLSIYMLSYTPLAYDEQSKGDYLLGALPVSRKQVVAAKYIMIVLEMASISVAMLLVNHLFGRFIFSPPSKELLSFNMIATMVLSGASFLSVLMPVTLRLGVLKSRMIAMFLYAGFFGTAGALFGIWGGERAAAYFVGNGWLLIGVAAALLLISYFASVKLYEKRDIIL